MIEKAQVDAELIRLTRLRSAQAEEQYRIRTNLRRLTVSPATARSSLPRKRWNNSAATKNG
ncbi:MAG: hypothetical protein H7Y43_07120 [Akkermansiaceae bacterium]|nr:hypothetical protein [Verrucomicrobiales bacterium]